MKDNGFTLTRCRASAVVLTALTLVAALGCGDDSVPSPEVEAEIYDSLAGYLPRLASSYATGELEQLRGYAAEKEIASTTKRVRDFMMDDGRVVRPSLVDFELEKVTIWNYSNAFVTTLETWNIEVLASGTEQVLASVENQRNRVRYQLKRREERWQVLERRIETTFETP